MALMPKIIRPTNGPPAVPSDNPQLQGVQSLLDTPYMPKQMPSMAISPTSVDLSSWLKKQKAGQ
jgi:hypothetical protein